MNVNKLQYYKRHIKLNFNCQVKQNYLDREKRKKKKKKKKP